MMPHHLKLDKTGLFAASDASDDGRNCPCCRNMEKLFIEQIRNVSVIVSTPFHRSIMPLIGPALIEVRLRGRELVSFPPQRRQTDDFSITVEEFSVAVEAYSAALDAINGRGESGGDIPKSDLQRALALRRAFTSMAQYAAALAEEASTVDV